MAREAGAKEVHVRSTEPPIYNPCFYGIDFADYHELIAWRNRNAENLEKAVAREIGADSVVFQSIEGLVEASGFKKDELCLACLNGDYPTPCGKKLAEMKLRNLNLEPNKP
jgi:amidophosphoribosyltransferase